MVFLNQGKKEFGLKYGSVTSVPWIFARDSSNQIAFHALTNYDSGNNLAIHLEYWNPSLHSMTAKSLDIQLPAGVSIVDSIGTIYSNQYSLAIEELKSLEKRKVILSLKMNSPHDSGMIHINNPTAPDTSIFKSLDIAVPDFTEDRSIQILPNDYDTLVSPNHRMQHQILFQNTTADTVRSIIVYQIVGDKFDFSQFKVEQFSHKVDLNIHRSSWSDLIIEYHYPNIYLAPGESGYITTSCQPKQDLFWNDELITTVEILYDYNLFESNQLVQTPDKKHLAFYDTVSVCRGEKILLPGSTSERSIWSTYTYTHRFLGESIDTFRSLHVHVRTTDTITVQFEVCQNETISFDTFDLGIGQHEVLVQHSSTCDTLFQIDITQSFDEMIIDTVVSYGAELFNQLLLQDTIIRVDFVTENGCQGIKIYNIDVLPAFAGLQDHIQQPVTVSKLFPNPTSGRLRISTESGIKIKAVQLVNRLGQLSTISLQNNQFDLPFDLPNGLYWIRIIKQNEDIHWHKIVLMK